MRSLAVLPSIFALATASTSLVIPELQSAASVAISRFAPAVTYSGPTGSATSVLHQTVAAATPSPTPSCAPYWLETIKHQGVAAFNSNSGYEVFRNVKSYGAKG
jgi:glucan 1,3-beta-glucosidase